MLGLIGRRQERPWAIDRKLSKVDAGMGANPTNTYKRTVLYAVLPAKENRSNAAYECQGTASFDYRCERVRHAFSGLRRGVNTGPVFLPSLLKYFRLDPRESLHARFRRSVDGRSLRPTSGLAGGPNRGSPRDVARRAHDGDWLPRRKPL
jgi:hypothetical protein